MRKVYVLAVMIVICIAVLAGCSQNSKKKGTAANSGSMMQADTAPKVQIPDEIDPALLALYNGVILIVTDMKTGTNKDVVVAFNSPTAIEGTPLTVEVTQFFPDFMMSPEGYFTQSNEPKNVAAKVVITGSAPEFSGWLFADFPDVHPYDNPDFNIKLKGAVKK